MTELPALPGTEVNRYQPASVAALASGGTGSVGPSGSPSVARSAATPIAGISISHGRACEA